MVMDHDDMMIVFFFLSLRTRCITGHHIALSTTMASVDPNEAYRLGYPDQPKREHNDLYTQFYRNCYSPPGLGM